MGRRSRVVAQPRPVRLSEWIQQPGRPVTRGELVNVAAYMIERRYGVEQEIRRHRRWYRRLWRWFTWIVRPTPVLTPAEMEAARAAALDPASHGTVAEEDEEELLETVEEGGVPFEETESGVKIRDRRGARD